MKFLENGTQYLETQLYIMKQKNEAKSCKHQILKEVKKA